VRDAGRYDGGYEKRFDFNVRDFGELAGALGC
jgi:hypothetical protein